MDNEALARRLVAMFALELEEQVRAMNADLLALEQAPGDAALLKSVFREAHTLKGAARSAGVQPVELLCHALESRLADVRDGKAAFSPGDFELFFAVADALGDAARKLNAGGSVYEEALDQLRDRLVSASSHSGPVRRPAPPAPADPPVPAESSAVRVDARKLDALVAAASELLTVRGRFDHRASEAASLHNEFERQTATWRRSARELRLACDRVGLGRLASSVIREMDDAIRNVVDRADELSTALLGDARALARSVDDVNVGVRQLRMRPFHEACEPLPRSVRDLASSSGKEVHLEVLGRDVEMDRAVVDGLREALLHLVRNAVDHGIEPPADRTVAGKSRTGQLRVSASLQGDHIVVTVTDDGRGLQVAALRQHLRDRGLDAPLDDRELARLLFGGGMSTRSSVTAISGRGVGMDLVRAAVERIRGVVSVTWEAGIGTTFTIECPLTLVSIRAVLVRLGAHLVAIPCNRIERLMRLSPDDLRMIEARPVVMTGDTPTPLFGLAQVLGPPYVGQTPSRALPTILLSAAGRRVAVAVDELVSETEVVIRPIGRGVAPARFASGASMLDSGHVAPVLDVEAVIAEALGLPPGGFDWTPAESVDKPARPQILVVDDSITTRALEQSVLEAAGYEVMTAVDGADAWRLLQDHSYDLVVADIEMPRMDGLALCEHIRASKRFRALPVILVTALESDEHRARGLEVGADAYIGKSSFDQRALLDTIAQLLDQAPTR